MIQDAATTPFSSELSARIGGVPAGSRAGWVGRHLLAASLLALLPAASGADPYPPNWSGGAGGAVHFQPVPWPANDGDGELDNGDWVPYTIVGADMEDNGTQDPSNGGTSPQNYVNVSSGCTDLTLPSILLYYDDANDVLMFRWRVEQIAHTYATGPNAGPYGSTDVWKSAQWTVLIDTDADGFREFAFLIDGSSGAPGTDVDRMLSIYSDTPSQSIDYVNNPAIDLIAHSPTAFVDGPSDFGTDLILNFQNALVPIPAWQNGSAETVWDYGTTRAVKVVHTTCTEYFVDYQIPLAALDATAVGGPAVTEDTPLCVLFSTANSLNNPLQKDVSLNCDSGSGCSFCADVDEPAPYGDCFKLGDFGGGDLGTIDQPRVTEITAAGCSPQLDAIVSDTLLPTTCGAPLDSSVDSVDFYYYYDADGDGLADDGNSWTFAAAATEVGIGEWRAAAGTWNTTVLRNGSYLIGVRAEDDQGNVTWSHLTQAEVNAMFSGDFANPTPSPGVLFEQFVNTCGSSPSATKSASATSVSVGSTVDFTITVSASTADSLTLTSIEDYLPTGWTFASNQGGTLSPTTSPSGGASGTLTWTFAPAVTIPAGASRTLIFRATAPLTQGTFSNSARAISSDDGNLDTNSVEVAVGAPRLTIAKTVNTSNAVPGGTVVFTITYSNDSPVSVTGTVITDPLPQGLTFVSATGGGTHDGLTPGTVTWNVGNLASGSGTFSVTYTATVSNPYSAANPAVNTATIDAAETSPTSDSASVFVTLPLRLQKSASSPQVAPGANVTFTLTYTNTGATAVTGVTITDPVPAGFTFVSATGGGTLGSGTVTWNIGNLAAGASGSVTVTLTAANPFTQTNPATNTATLSATGISPISDSYTIGVTQACTTNTTYYFKNATANVGFDGTRSIANTTVPTSGTATQTAVQTLAINATNVEIGRFYQDPAQVTGGGLSTITSTFYINKTESGTKIDFRLQAYAYNPTTGAATLLGTTATFSANGGSGFYVATGATITPSGPLPSGHRIQWRIVADNTSGGGKTADVTVVYDGTSQQAQSSFCVTPYRRELDKQVNNLSVAPGGTLQYTLQFGNPGTASLTGATIVDTLPTGVSFTSATLNGSSITPGISGQQLTFTVNSTGAASGTIVGGGTGTLVINVSVASPLSTSISTLLNDATLSVNETTSVSDSASTVVNRPNLVISKAASDTLVFAGDTVTYTLTLTNSGNATAANVSIADDIPNQTYYPYVAASCSINTTAAPSTSSTSCTPSGSPVGSLAITANQLAPGETIVVTFQMTVTSSPAPPSGLSTHDNVATATSTTDTAVATSETVTVTISTNPNLTIAKTSDAAGTLGVDDLVTYTITLGNTGSATATGVVVSDPIPANTSYVAGTITYQAASQTDANDGDTGRYELLADRVVWAVGSLAPGASRTMTFQVQLDSVLPSGTTTITNTATATAANAASQNDSVDVSASAAPTFDLVKSGPSSLAFPLTTLASAASATTTISVVSATYLVTGDWISINGTAAQILGISGTTVTLSTAVTAANGTNVIPIIEYTLTWENTGDATATGVVVTDALPASTVFVSATGGGTHNGGSPGTVTWTVGTLAPGDSATVRLRIRPTAVGTYLNDFDLDSNETALASSNTVTTQVGALRPSKTTSTPSVTNTPDGTKATYTLTVVNDSAVNATGVTVTDTMATGFDYCDNSCDDGTTNFNNPTFNVTSGSRTSTVNPTVGDNPLTFCCWTVNAGATLTITFDARIGIAVGDGTYQNELVTSSNNVAALTFDPLATTAEDVTVDFVGPNPVMLSGFGVSLVDGEVTVSWETDAELDAMAYRVYRREGAAGGYLPIHRGLLPGLIGAPQGGVYSLTDPGAPAGEPLSYILVELDGRGRRTSYGPYEVPAPGEGERLVPTAKTKRTGYGAVPHPLRQPPSEDAALTGPSLKASGKAGGARIGVRADGLQRLAVADLAVVLGVTVDDVHKLVQSRRLRLTLGGADVAWMPEGDGKAPAAILFYGRGGDTRWSVERTYRLELLPGRLMATVSGAPRAGVAGAMFRDTARFERDVYPLVLGRLDPDADLYYWDFAFAGFAGFDRRTFDLDLDGGVTTGSDAVVRVRLQGGTELGSGAHGVALAWDGVGIGTTTLGSFEGREVALTVPAALAGAGVHQLEVKATGATTSGMSLVLIDTIAVDYDRAYSTTRAAVEVNRGTATTLAVSGLPAPDSTVLDISNPQVPKRVTGVATSQSGGGWEVRFAASGTRYLVATAGGLLTPSLRADHASDLRSSDHRADWVAVTTSALAGAAERLADLRRAQGLEALVVDVDDVYDEFSGGQPTPWALREFLTWAVAEWEVGPRYLVLAGDGHYDFHGATGIGGNLLPPAILGASWGLFASDGPLGDLLGNDGVPEVVVGRVPVSTAAELDAYVTKVAAAEAGGSWNGTILFAADDPDPTGNYTSDSEALAALVPPGSILDRVYLGPLSPSAARSQLVADLQAGVSLVSYLGHSGITTLANEGLLTSADVSGLQNQDRAPVFLAMGCHLGNFAIPGSPSLAEDLLTRADGGAVAVWSAVGISYNPLRARLTAESLRAVYHDGDRVLGDVVRKTLAAASASGLGRSLAESQILLGDPGIRLPEAP